MFQRASISLTPGDAEQVWGPLIFESRRWVELRQKSFWRQFLSAESTGMGIFYTLNVFCIQVSALAAMLVTPHLQAPLHAHRSAVYISSLHLPLIICQHHTTPGPGPPQDVQPCALLPRGKLKTAPYSHVAS